MRCQPTTVGSQAQKSCATLARSSNHHTNAQARGHLATLKHPHPQHSSPRTRSQSSETILKLPPTSLSSIARHQRGNIRAQYTFELCRPVPDSQTLSCNLPGHSRPSAFFGRTTSSNSRKQPPGQSIVSSLRVVANLHHRCRLFVFSQLRRSKSDLKRSERRFLHQPRAWTRNTVPSTHGNYNLHVEVVALS